ncbi:MAG: glycosyltransferase family 39 protein [Herpetosiphonaceae bacterium]|nr:glycosyltransferase family 39 protein [Herpetosiphonaceae bacterium]
MNSLQAVKESIPAGWTTKAGLHWLRVPVSALLLFGLGLWHLADPPMWWDEGWTTSVARNWVERGLYGRLLSGQSAPTGLEASFWVTGPVALSFRLFGVGIWQARLFGVLCTVLTLGLIYYLAHRLYNRVVAVGTIAVLLLLSIHPQLHPLLMGRQVLGEMPMLCYLLAGYTCLLLALRRSTWFIGVAVVCWAVAVSTKAQVLPFWALSLLAPFIWTVVQRRWRVAMLLCASIFATLGGVQLLLMGMNIVWQGHRVAATSEYGTVTGLYDVLAIVPTLFNRLFALQNVLVIGVPTLCGLGYAANRLWHDLHRDHTQVTEATIILRLVLWSVSGSWLAWFVLLSVGVPRYLFPATFIGSIFVAAFLYDLTDHFNVMTTLNRAIQGLLHQRWNRQTAGAWLVLLLLMEAFPLTLRTISHYYLHGEDRSAQRVAQFLDTITPPHALIETYESELHFLLHRPYHFPPDQTHVTLNHRSLLGQTVTVDYDPLAANPDYLVLGTFSKGNNLYTPVLKSGAFRLIHEDGQYSVYQRVR